MDTTEFRTIERSAYKQASQLTKLNIEMQGNGSKLYRIDISLASLQIAEITSYLLGSTTVMA
jgi:hypothetical protein